MTKFCASKSLQTALRTPESSHGDWIFGWPHPFPPTFQHASSQQPSEFCNRLWYSGVKHLHNPFVCMSWLCSLLPLPIQFSNPVQTHTIPWDFSVPPAVIVSRVSWWREGVSSAWWTCSRSHISLNNDLRASQGVTEWMLILNWTARTSLVILPHIAYWVYSTPFSFLLVSMVSVIILCESSTRKLRIKKCLFSLHC